MDTAESVKMGMPKQDKNKIEERVEIIDNLLKENNHLLDSLEKKTEKLLLNNNEIDREISSQDGIERSQVLVEIDNKIGRLEAVNIRLSDIIDRINL